MSFLLALLVALFVDGARAVKDAQGNIIELDLTSTWVTDGDLGKVAQMRHLRKLDLSLTRVTDAGLEQLKGLENVVDLNCYYAERLTEDGIAHLRGWKYLEHLGLRGTKVTSQVFEHLAHLTSLRSLDLGFTQIEDEGFEHLASLTRLEKLSIGGNRLSGACLLLLKQLPALVDLDVSGIQRVDSGLWGLPLTAENLARIGQLRQLRALNLAGATLADRGVDRPGHPEAERAELRDLTALAGLINLERLDLTRQPVTAEAISGLSALPKLQELRLGLARKLDDSAVPVLLSLKTLRKLYLAGTKLSPQSMEKLKGVSIQGL
jgi:Leucine-rich repeat (LRR) protein